MAVRWLRVVSVWASIAMSVFGCARSKEAAPSSVATLDAGAEPTSSPSLEDHEKAAREKEIGDLAAEIGKKARNQADGSSPASPKNGTYLGRFTEEDVVTASAIPGASAMHAATTDKTLVWKIAEWKARPNTLVALSHRRARFVEDGPAPEAEVVVLEPRSGGLARVADGKAVVPHPNCVDTSGNDEQFEENWPDFQFDLAPYVIAKGNTAVGVRMNCHNGFPAGEGYETHLLLLETQANGLRTVFNEVIADSNHDRVGAVDTEMNGIVVVQTSAHGGYFDLSVRATTKTIPFDMEDESAKKAKKPPPPKVETRVFVWSGERYLAAPHSPR